MASIIAFLIFFFFISTILNGKHNIDAQLKATRSHFPRPIALSDANFLFVFPIFLKVDNLTYRTTPEDLRRVFERCGEVGDIYIPRDRYTRESRGFAFVR